MLYGRIFDVEIFTLKFLRVSHRGRDAASRMRPGVFPVPKVGIAIFGNRSADQQVSGLLVVVAHVKPSVCARSDATAPGSQPSFRRAGRISSSFGLFARCDKINGRVGDIGSE